MVKPFGKLASVTLAATIVGGGFGINANANASELESDANTYEINASALEESINATEEFKITVTFTPAGNDKFGPIDAQNTTVRTYVGSKIDMVGAYFAISEGERFIRISGITAYMLAPGTAVVQAYKSNGTLNGVYTFEIAR